MDWEGRLRDAWEQIARHPSHVRLFRTQRLSATFALNAHAGLRAPDIAPCLIIETVLDARRHFEVGGMRLSSALGEDGPFAVLSLEDPVRADLFTMVCADALQVAEAAVDGSELAAFLARLEAWRQFLRERRPNLSRNEVVGLVGELLVLNRLLKINPASFQTWSSPNDGLHDFERSGHSLEVKTTLGPATLVHIFNLDQLDPGGVRLLHMIHLRLVESPDGRSLEELAGLVRALLVDESGRQDFDNALLRRGLMPTDFRSRSEPKIVVRDWSAYLVDDSFPKLIRSSVPLAVGDASYSLDLRRIAPHGVDLEATLLAFAGIGATA